MGSRESTKEAALMRASVPVDRKISIENLRWLVDHCIPVDLEGRQNLLALRELLAIREGSAKTIESIIGEALGEASMCWNPPPSNQVFDSTRAAKIMDRTVLLLLALEKKP